jgi:hypothetical protein
MGHVEQFRQNSTVSNGITTVPTLAYRQGNFGTAGCLAYIAAANICAYTPVNMNTNTGAAAVDPAGQTLTFGEIFDPTTQHIVNGSLVATPFPNNTIPMSRFNSVSTAIQNMLPLPNAPGIVNNYTIPAYQNWQHTTIYSWKLDHSLSPTSKLSWYFAGNRENSPNANGFTGAYAVPAPTANRNITTRANFDDTLRPTLLLHVGVGYINQYQPTDYPSFNQSSIGLSGYAVNNRFPTIGGLDDFFTGGWGPGFGGLGPGFIAFIWEQKPTANTNLTWVKGNHSYKFGGEYTGEGYPEHSEWRTNGDFSFAPNETGDPWQNLQPFTWNIAGLTQATGFNYASFPLGLPDQLSYSPLTQTRLGGHLMGLYAQDSWKVTRKFTLDYGLRYDFQTYLKEEHGRMQDASFTTLNGEVGLPGAGIYEGYGGGRCNCALSHNYPYAFGPRVGAAYQINAKTVLRGGAGISYGLVQTPAGTSYSVADYYQFNATGYGISPLPGGLGTPNPAANVTWPNFSNDKYPVPTNGLLPPQSPFIFYNPSARPPRILQWSFGIQRESAKRHRGRSQLCGQPGGLGGCASDGSVWEQFSD